MTDDPTPNEIPAEQEVQEVDPVLHLAELTLMALSTYMGLNPPRIAQGDLGAMQQAQQLQNIMGALAQLCEALGSELVSMKPEEERGKPSSGIILPG